MREKLTKEDGYNLTKIIEVFNLKILSLENQKNLESL